MIKQLLFHGSWLVFPVIAWLLWRWRKRQHRAAIVVVLLGCSVFVWARFIEPQMIVIRHTTLERTGTAARIALVSDIHLGVYKDRRFLERLVARINDQDVHAVAIAGDLTYEPQGLSLQELFAPLADLRAPAFVVLGNHDQQQPGPDIDKPLRAALAAHGMNVIEGRLLRDTNGVNWAGLGDRWAGRDDARFLLGGGALLGPTIILAHNPDSAMQVCAGNVAVVLAGHTHGGQIRIPWLYRKVIPSAYGFDRGEQVMQGACGPIRVFTTSGTGEIGLPLRLFNPPVIDVLTLEP